MIDQILGMLCMGFFIVIFVISVAIVLWVRFLKGPNEARKVAKGMARSAVFQAARKWLRYRWLPASWPGRR